MSHRLRRHASGHCWPGSGRGFGSLRSLTGGYRSGSSSRLEERAESVRCGSRPLPPLSHRIERRTMSPRYCAARRLPSLPPSGCLGLPCVGSSRSPPSRFSGRIGKRAGSPPPPACPTAPITLLEACSAQSSRSCAEIRGCEDSGREGKLVRPESLNRLGALYRRLHAGETFVALLQPLPWHGKRGLESMRQRSDRGCETRPGARAADPPPRSGEAYCRLYYARNSEGAGRPEARARSSDRRRVAAGDAAPFELKAPWR
jgi:hypothetical protein